MDLVADFLPFFPGGRDTGMYFRSEDEVVGKWKKGPNRDFSGDAGRYHLHGYLYTHSDLELGNKVRGTSVLHYL